MGRGLSRLQRRILRALEGFPTLEASTREDVISLRGWAEPRHLLEALSILPTATNRTVLSRALERLNQRGLVAKHYGELAIQGKAARYALITDPANAGSRSYGPMFVLTRPGPKETRPKHSMEADYSEVTPHEP